jgi:hypothetical protein
MRFTRLRRASVIGCLCWVAGAATVAVQAQEDGVNGPPKVLVIQREFTKPGKGGALHEKTEAVYLHAMAAAGAKPRYLAMVSLSGRSRALFFSGYSSLAAWEEENKDVASNTALSAALDRANVADGDLLSETSESVWVRRDDLSLNAGNLLGVRYMEIRQFLVRPGHAREWDELVKLVMAGYNGVPQMNWVTFESQYGPEGHAFLIITRLKSMADADQMLGQDKGFAEALGEGGLKKLAGLEASCLESEQTNLFQITPKMSYPPEAWVKAEPSFWKPKPAVAGTTKAEDKPAPPVP